jgi:sterol desaturase/sphingolipid hydroxylase (fatty acid hydroxylase superfamily)
MHALKWLFSRGFLYSFLITGLIAAFALDFDNKALFVWFMAPFYVIALLSQYLAPRSYLPLEKSELTTDLLSNGMVLFINMIQNAGLAFFFSLASSSLLIHFGWVSPMFAAANLPFWAQILVGLLVFDFMFYVTHRMAHEIPFFWRFHSVHHCAHRVTFLNAYRAHPLDVMWRRFVPLFVVLQTGISQEALVAAMVIATVLATITHLNTDLKHGWLNYIIGTNEVHRWHHSADPAEAKNFAIIMLWDHLFGTFYFPRDRDKPERTGLTNEDNYPVHNYWQQLLLPFRWHRLNGNERRDESKNTDAPRPVQPASGTQQ